MPVMSGFHASNGMETVACNIVEIPVAKLWKNNLQLSVKSTCKKHDGDGVLHIHSSGSQT